MGDPRRIKIDRHQIWLRDCALRCLHRATRRNRPILPSGSSRCREATVTTIEGVSGDEDAAVKQAWRELDVVQFGFCQSGQIIQVVDLLKLNSKPTDEMIDSVMGGNACRCATYTRIRTAIHRAAEILEA